MDFGILPFVQSQLNNVAHTLSGHSQGANLEPNASERQLLSALGSGYSTTFRQFQQKHSLALSAYLLNLTLSKVPRYEMLKELSLDSIMYILPQRIDGYKKMWELLLNGLPDVVPGGLSRDGDKYEVDRKPMAVSFVNASGKAELFGEGEPHVIFSADFGHKPLDIGSLRFMGVEDYDIVTKSPQFVLKLPGKGRYVNVVNHTMSTIQKLHLDSFEQQIRAADNGKNHEKHQRKVLYKPIQYGFFGRPNSPYVSGDHQLDIISAVVALPKRFEKRQLPMIEIGLYENNEHCKFTTSLQDIVYEQVPSTNILVTKRGLGHLVAHTKKPDFRKVKKEVRKMVEKPLVIVGDRWIDFVPSQFEAMSVTQFVTQGLQLRPIVVVDEAMLYLGFGTVTDTIAGIVDPVGDLWTELGWLAPNVHIVGTLELYELVIRLLASQYHHAGFA